MATRRSSRTPPSRRAGGSGRPARPTAITNLQDTKRPNRCKWIVYGASGIGKTVLAGSAPKAFFITTDVEGTASAKAFGSTADELQVSNWAAFVNVVDWLEYEGHREYGFIIVDTIDELEELCWKAQLVDPILKRASKYQPNKGDYPIVWRKIKEELMRLHRLPVNTLYLAHDMRVDKEDEDGEDTVTLAMPAVGSTKRGDLSAYLCGQMTLVGYYRSRPTDDGEPVRQLLTQSGPRWVAKDRHNVFGRGITNPTIPKMLERIEQGGTATPRRRARRAAR